MVRIDTHAHIFHGGLRFVANPRYCPDYDAPLASYLNQLDKHGMTHGVLVQPSFLGSDNDYLLESLREARGRLRGIVVVDPTISLSTLQHYAATHVVGIRLNLIGVETPDMKSGVWQTLLYHLVALDWQVEVQQHAARLPDIIPALLDAGVTVVVDHFGLPDQSLGTQDPGWLALRQWAVSPRLWLKLSAPYRTGSMGERMAVQAYPLLREAFGDRLLWGSDWPHTRFEKSVTYADMMAALPRIVPNAAERDQLLSAGKGLFKF